MSRIRMGARVARNLHSTEHAVDAAMIAASSLVQAMLEARADARLAAEVGQAALDEIIFGLSGLNSVRQSVVAGHKALGDVAESQGILWRLEGPLEEKMRPLDLQPSAVA